jgi:hypothetical protein
LKNEDDLPLVGTQCTFEVGVHKSPICKPVLDYNFTPPRVTEYEVNHYEYRYWLEDSPKMISELIKKYGEPIKNMSVSIARLSGETHYEDNTSYSVFSRDDFINVPIEDLIEMNIGGHIKKGDPKSTIKKYQEHKKRLAQLEAQGHNQVLPINPQTAQFLEQNKLSIDDLVNKLRFDSITVQPQSNETPKKESKRRLRK